MADLQLGETFSRQWTFVSTGAALTIADIGFRPDYVRVARIDAGVGVDGSIAKAEWWRPMANADAVRTLVQDAATAGFTHDFDTTNGISVVTNAAGVDSSDSGIGQITAITVANPPVVSDTAHGLADGDIIRITDIDTSIANMVEVNNRRFRVNNAAADTFELQDPETRENIDGSAFTAFAGTARWNQLNRVDADRDVFDAETYDLVLGTATHANTFRHVVQAVKFGDFEDLG